MNDKNTNSKLIFIFNIFFFKIVLKFLKKGHNHKNKMFSALKTMKENKTDNA